MMNNCLTIAEENEDDLEEFIRDDRLENDNENNLDRLSIIYESPHSSTDIDENLYEKLIVYDIAHFDPPIKSIPEHSLTKLSFAPCPNLTNTLTAVRTSSLMSNPITSLSLSLQGTSIEQQQQHSSSSLSSPMLFPLDDNPMQLPSSSHVIKMKVIQSSLSSLSDFISSTPVSNIENHSSSLHEQRPSLTRAILLSHCASNPTPRRLPSDPLSNEQFRTNSSSSSSEIFFSSDEKLLSRSDYLHQHQSSVSPQRKSSSLKNISPNILYPIEFSHHPKSSHKVPTSDSGILIDTRPTSKSSIDQLPVEDHQLERIYEQTLRDLRLIKQHLVEIESRLAEAMREVKE